MKKVLLDLTVKEALQVNSNCVLLIMTCEGELPEVVPGQFAELRIDNTPTVMLRRPISVHSYDKARNEIGFLVQLVGDGTRWLGSLKAGDKVNTLLPLGNGFTMPEAAGGNTGAEIHITPPLRIIQIRPLTTRSIQRSAPIRRQYILFVHLRHKSTPAARVCQPFRAQRTRTKSSLFAPKQHFFIFWRI